MPCEIVPDLQLLFPDILLSEVVPIFDGASIHREQSVVACLNNTFSSNWIGNNSQDIQWPPRSPGKVENQILLMFVNLFIHIDLSPLDFSYFHSLRCKVFENAPNTLRQLRQRVEMECSTFDIKYLQKLILKGFLHHLMVCRQNGGKQFELYR